MKKLRIPLQFLLAAVLLISSVGLPIAVLGLGDLRRNGKISQEPLPYNLNVEQEPYSTIEKLEIICQFNGQNDSVTLAQQDLKETELWNQGLVQDVVDQTLAVCCRALGVYVPDMEIAGAIQFTFTDIKKPALSVRVWGLELSGAQAETGTMVLDMDTGLIYSFELGSNRSNRWNVETEAVYAVLQSQLVDAGDWYRKDESTAVLRTDEGAAYFDLAADEWWIGWTPMDAVLYSAEVLSESEYDKGE